MEQLFTQALGLSAPWCAVSVDLRPAEGVITFQIDNTAKRLDCPACGAADQPIHDRLPRSWRHLNFFQYQATLQARVPPVACTRGEKTSQVEVPWSREGSGFTQTREVFIVALCEQMPVLAVSQLLGVSDDRVWRVLDHHVKQARAKEDPSQVRRISADERSARKGQRYVTLFCDTEERRVLFATPGKDAATFAAFAGDRAAHGGDAQAITDVSLDMSAAYQAGVRQHCPNAVVSFDPFDVIALANDAMERCAGPEVKQEASLKGIGWGTLRDAAKWTAAQIAPMHGLQRSGLKTARAWRIKQRLRDVFSTCTNIDSIAAALDQLGQALPIGTVQAAGCDDAKTPGRPPRTLSLRLNNGFAEAINGRIQAAKARVKGYGTDAHLITISYLVCAKLKHLPKNSWLHPAQHTGE